MHQVNGQSPNSNSNLDYHRSRVRPRQSRPVAHMEHMKREIGSTHLTPFAWVVPHVHGALGADPSTGNPRKKLSEKSMYTGRMMRLPPNRTYIPKITPFGGNGPIYGLHRT